MVCPEQGRPPGSVRSPRCANVDLHEGLDTGGETVVHAHCRGTVVLSRDADDCGMGCERAADARRMRQVRPQRFATSGWESNTDTTQVVDCGRPQRPAFGHTPGTCSVLGVVHSWGKTWRGSDTITRQTEGKRLRRTRGECWRWGRDNRHRPLQEQDAAWCAQRRGYAQSDGVRCQSQCLNLVYDTATRAWRYWLNRRGGRKRTWRACGRRRAASPLPRPQIVPGGVACRERS